MAPAPVIRLHPDDGVLIARSSLPRPGWREQLPQPLPSGRVDDLPVRRGQRLRRALAALEAALGDASRGHPSVAFVAGEVFYASHANPCTLRVSFGLLDKDLLEEGVARLCSVAMDLMRPRSAPSAIFT